jgi:glyoxylase I family protein
MDLKLHHINLATENVARMDRFYRDVLGLKTETEGLPTLEKKKGYAGDVAFVSDGHIQTHLAQKDLFAGFKTGHFVNPVERGHIAYRTSDLAGFKAHLDAQNIPYSDWGETAVAGWQQIFFYDPDGNVIEVHQVNEGPEAGLQTAQKEKPHPD